MSALTKLDPNKFSVHSRLVQLENAVAEIQREIKSIELKVTPLAIWLANYSETASRAAAARELAMEAIRKRIKGETP